MFNVKAAFSEQFDVGATAERARTFFNDLRNFVELVPGVERITAEAGGVMRWLIRAEIPVIGAVRHAFPVEQSVDSPGLIEWSPARGEKKNFLRYTASFEEREGRTRVRVEQRVELRRQAARELHPLAPLVGEGRLSAELQKRLTEMMRAFVERARARLEK